eukprot:21956-Pelagococcus_subviridis.AAC.1
MTCVAFAHNLLRRHPGCAVLVHRGPTEERASAAEGALASFASDPLVPVRPRRRGERRSLRTFSPGVSLRPGSLAFNRRPRRLSTSTDAFRLHPDFVRARARPGEVRRAEEFAVGAEDARGVALSPAGGKARQDDPRARPVGPSEDERAPGEGAVRGVVRESRRGGAGREGEGAFYTMVPIRPRSRGERRSLRTLPSDSLRPSLAFNTRPRRLSTPTDAFQLHPDIA